MRTVGKGWIRSRAGVERWYWQRGHCLSEHFRLHAAQVLSLTSCGPVYANSKSMMGRCMHRIHGNGRGRGGGAG